MMKLWSQGENAQSWGRLGKQICWVRRSAVRLDGSHPEAWRESCGLRLCQQLQSRGGGGGL